MKHETIESRDYPGHWHVEAIHDDGSVYVAVFSGPDAKERAAEYERFMLPHPLPW